MTEPFSAASVLAGLTAFQRDTVRHIMNRFFGDAPTTRFLTADETGLGKSLVARGVIASLIEKLQHDDSVGRVDIIYVCSNIDIAEQNLERLNVTGEDHLPFASRLTLLAKESHRLRGQLTKGLKPVNLVSFTPGTSFETGHRGGQSEERALLLLILTDLLKLNGPDYRRLKVLMRAKVHPGNFNRTISSLERHLRRHNGPDPLIVDKFRQEIGKAGSNPDGSRSLRHDVHVMIDEIGQRQSPRKADEATIRRLIGGLRGALARASIDSLEPDLVILDEFQRFRHLLNLEDGGPAAELAHDLFNYDEARVLLLSATPYKPFTYAEERLEGDDHQKDFMATLSFLVQHDEAFLDAIRQDLGRLRAAAITGSDPTDATTQIRKRLLHVLCRTERPLARDRDMLAEAPCPADDLAPEDLVDLAALKATARRVDAPFSVEYWKSAPYFVNFLDGYKVGVGLREALKNSVTTVELRPILERTRHLDRTAIRGGERMDPGNARLRRLLADTVEQGWWKLLWMPPSLPYLAPSTPYGLLDAATVTKRVVFSSWSATPTAVAALVSHDAQRRITGQTESRSSRPTSRLEFGLTDGRPERMSTLALFWPNPGLATRTDPLGACSGEPEPVDPRRFIASAARDVSDLVGRNGTSKSSAAESWHWLALFRIPGAVPADLVEDPTHLALALAGALPGLGKLDADDSDTSDPQGLRAHVEWALGAADLSNPGQRPTDLTSTVAALGAHGPGNIAWRAIGRQLGPGNTVTEAGHWDAAATIASGLRSLFNRPDVTSLLTQLYPSEVYWRAVLAYCAAGNLQATLDEYLHHLAGDRGPEPLDDKALLKLAAKVRAAIAMRPAPYTAFDPFAPDDEISFSARFALRYGNKRQTEGDVRQPAVRNAFNSPFWPFVLATTSVGQEGIDLHWWCHAVVHWNTPASPVDFDQREGRVHRYGGHAIRKNVAAYHRADMLRDEVRDPWEAGYAAATELRAELGDLTPHWVYPGSAKVLRITYPYPLSIDHDRLRRLKDDVALYRLTLGQPRQEDLLDLLRRRGIQGDEKMINQLRLDLTPPPLARSTSRQRGEARS